MSDETEMGATAPIRVGIIGASPDSGWAAWAHIPALNQLPEYRLSAVSTSRRESADEAGRRFGVELAYDNHDDLLARPEVDLAVISVRVPHHRTLASAAMAAGKAVLCEWPLGNGLAEAEELAAMARETGVRTAIGLQSRAAPIIRRIRDLVREGYVGRVLSTTLLGAGYFWGPRIDAGHRFILDKSNGVTLLSIQVGHRLDMLCFCLGEFDYLSANMTNGYRSTTVIETGEVVDNNVDDDIAVIGMLEGGASAVMHYRASASPDTNLLWEINGTEGTIQLSDPSGTLAPETRLRGVRGEDTELAPLDIPASYYALTPEQAPGVAFGVGHAYAQLASDIRLGTMFAPTFDDAVLRHRMLDAIERSAATGERVRYR